MPRAFRDRSPRRWLLPPAGLLLAALLPLAPAAVAADETEPAQRQLRIIGGAVSRPGMWPSMVSLQIGRQSTASTDNHFCGGTIIGGQWVLTAAHCVYHKGSVLPPGAIGVAEGVRVLDGRSGHIVRVAEIIPHPRYATKPSVYDVALLRLREPSQQPRQKLLASAHRDDTLRPGAQATVTGFGLTRAGDNDSGSEQLRQVNLPIVAQQQCIRGYSDVPPRAFGDFAMCAGRQQGGVDSCQGDSGGPLFAIRDDESVQVGVVSWGDGCAKAGRPGIYASVGFFEPWIRSHVRDADFTRSAVVPPTPQPVPSPTPTPSPVPTPTPAVTPTPAPVLPVRPAAAEPACLTAGVVPGTLTPLDTAQLTIDIVQGNRLALGSTVNFRVQSSVDGELVVYAINAENKPAVLFPNNRTTGFQAGQASPTIQAGQTVRIPGYADGFVAKVQPPVGNGVVCAVVTPATQESRANVRRLLALPAGTDLTTFAANLRGIRIDNSAGSAAAGVAAGASTSVAVGSRAYEVVSP